MDARKRKITSVEIISVCLASLLTILCLNMLIKTLIVKIISSVFIAVSVPILLFFFIGGDAMFKLPLMGPSNINDFGGKFRILVFQNFTDILLYLAGLLASLAVILIPPIDVNIYAGSVATTFLSLSSVSVVRVLSGYFIVCVFPGSVIYTTLLRRRCTDVFEKMGLFLIISYCFSVILGLILQYLKVFSILNFLVSLWIIVIAIIIQSHLRSREKTELQAPTTSSFRLSSFLLVLFLVAYVFFSYFLVLFICPLTGLTSYDVVNYLVYAKRFTDYNVISFSFDQIRGGMLPYIFSNFFYWIVSSITSLPMIYSYTGLQFYQILVPISFYVFTKKLLKDKWISIVATFLLLFSNGLTGLALLTSPTMLKAYMGSETLSVLWNYLFNRVRSPGSTPLILSTHTFDYALIFLALTYAYEYLSSEKGKTSNLFLSVLFACTAFYTHNLMFILSFFITLLLLPLVQVKLTEKVIVLIFSTLGLIIVFDPVTFWFFSSWLREVLILDATSIFIAVFSTTAYILLIFLRASWKGLSWTNLLFKRNCSDCKKLKVGLWLTGSCVFSAATFLFLLQSEATSWAFFILKFYGITLPLAIVAIPYLTGVGEKSRVFLLSFTLSFLILPVLVAIPLASTSYLSILSRSSLSYLLFPLSILAAITLSRLKNVLAEKSCSKTRIMIKIRKHQGYHNVHGLLYALLIFSLVFALIPVQTLSRIYVVETFYLKGGKERVSNEVAKALEFVNHNVSRGSTILALPREMELVTSGLTPCHVKVLPVWLVYVLLKTPPEHILRTLHSLDVDYVLVNNLVKPNPESVTDRELDGSQLLSLSSTFPIVYKNDEIVIYRVPNM